MSKIYFGNGKIFTGEDETTFVSAMMVEDGYVGWTGKTQDIPGEYVDLMGKTVVPGFVDSHMHPTYVASVQDQVPCMPPYAHNIEEIVNLLREEADKQAEATGSHRNTQSWIEGWGFDESKIAEGRAPDRWDLDRVSKDRPVQIMRSCFHVRTLNSKALEICEIDKDFPDIVEGIICRNEEGDPTGVLYEAAHWYVEGFKPQLSNDERVEAMANLTKRFGKLGITGITEVMGRPGDFEMYQEAGRKGLKQHIAVYNRYTDCVKEGIPETFLTRDPEAQIKFAGMKTFLDGSISGHTAAMKEPYPGTEDKGLVLGTAEDLAEWYEYVKPRGLQLIIHAMGDATIQMIIDFFKDKEPWVKFGPSLRIEHCTILSDDMIDELAEAKIGASLNVNFVFAEYSAYKANLDDDRFARAARARSCYEKMEYLSLASDSPATLWAVPEDPFMGIQAAVIRKAYGGQDITQKEAITVPQAILLYTNKAATMCSMPRVGQLKPGYFADFVILDRDIFTIPGDEIMKISVEETFVRGESIYKK